MKTERRVSLSVKISILIIILTFGSAALSILAGYREHIRTTDKYYEDLSRNIAHTVSNSLNGARVRLLLDAAQEPEYREILRKARQDQDPEPIIAYLESRHLLLTYDNISEVLKQYTQYMDVEYIYLQYIGNGTFCRLVDPDEGYLSFGLTDKLDGPYVKYSGKNEAIPATVSDTDLGTLVTSFEPVYDNEGNSVALVGVDVNMEKMRSEHRRFALLSFVNALVMASVAAAAGVLFIRHTVTNPLEKLARQTRTFTNKRGRYTSDDIIDIDVHSRDEIEDLYGEIHSMEKKIVSYLDHLIKVTGEKERARTELNIAAQIQNDMLPQTFPPFPHRREFDLYASMDPAREVGGDFYDFFMIDDDHLAMVIADVSGKGVPAALFMAISKSLLKTAMSTGESPAAVFTRLNNQICAGNTSGMFVTVWAGVLEISTGILTACNAGHEYPALSRCEQPFELYKDKHGLVMAAMSGVRYTDYQITLSEGDRIFVYTDGAPEATNASLEQFGTGRIIEALNSEPDAGPETLIRNVTDSISSFVQSSPQFDDTTMLALVYTPGSLEVH